MIMGDLFWQDYYSNKTNGEHHSQDEDFLKKEAKEKLFHLGDGSSILDFGCGSADLFVYYAQKYSKCVGVDMSKSMLEAAQNRLILFGIQKNITLINADDSTIWDCISDKYDNITTAGVMQHLTINEIDNFIFNAKEHLTHNGKICLFDIIDSRLYPLWKAGLFRESNSISSFKFIINILLRLPIKKLFGKRDVMGYAQHPNIYIDIANKYSLKIRFIWSMYYAYRYHVIYYKNNYE